MIFKDFNIISFALCLLLCVPFLAQSQLANTLVLDNVANEYYALKSDGTQTYFSNLYMPFVIAKPAYNVDFGEMAGTALEGNNKALINFNTAKVSVDGSLNTHSDVNLAGTSLDYVLGYNGSNWTPRPDNDNQTLTEILTVSTDAGANNITNLADPILDQDAATKKYVDDTETNNAVSISHITNVNLSLGSAVYVKDDGIVSALVSGTPPFTGMQIIFMCDQAEDCGFNLQISTPTFIINGIAYTNTTISLLDGEAIQAYYDGTTFYGFKHY